MTAGTREKPSFPTAFIAAFGNATARFGAVFYKPPGRMPSGAESLAHGGRALAQDHVLPPTGGQDAQAEPSGAELRAAPRFTLLIRVAKLIADDREFLCILRDASATGMKVRLFAPLPAHRNLAIELGNGERHGAELVWCAQDHAGLRFVGEVDVARLIDESHGEYPRRQVRLQVSLDAMLKSGTEVVHATFQDMSQQGACVLCGKWLLINELVRLDTGVLAPIYAKVRWRDHPRYGLIFEQTFRLDELARISAPLQPAGPMPPVAVERAG